MDQTNLKKLVIYYSEDGNTKKMAEAIAKEANADRLELKLKNDKKRTGFSRFFVGGAEVYLGKNPELKPFDKNPSDYDIIYIGTPVWGGRPVPAIKSLLSKTSFHGKNIALFCTYGGSAGKTFEKMKKALEGNNFIGELGSVEPKKKADKAKESSIKGWAVDVLKNVK